jgi:hypothetical protein
VTFTLSTSLSYFFAFFAAFFAFLAVFLTSLVVLDIRRSSNALSEKHLTLTASPVEQQASWCKRQARTLSSCWVVRLHNHITHDFPPKKTASPSQRARTLIPKDNQIFRL